MFAARDGLARATADGCDVVVVDTAGRLQIDEELMDELARVRDAVKTINVLLGLDAMTGQEAGRGRTLLPGADRVRRNRPDEASTATHEAGAALSATGDHGRPV